MPNIKVNALRDFASRHIGPTEDDLALMLETVGYNGLEQFIEDVVPASIRINTLATFGKDVKDDQALTEPKALEQLTKFANDNGSHKSMLGLGYYGCHTPEPINRLILENPAWYTAYTPYQPEISQGRLSLLFAFQTMTANLCSLDMANASLLDEATAAAEAMTMLWRTSKKEDKDIFLVDSDIHPQILAVVTTRAKPLGIELKLCDDEKDFVATGACGALLSNPGSSGRVKDFSKLITDLKNNDVRTAICTDLLALLLVKTPGEMGASIAIGSSQRFGMPMGAGGPHAAFIAFDADLVRQCPGRLVGVSVDSKKRKAYRLALQTREQHIRRDKATSNICTAQTLPALVATTYAIYHGKDGLKEIAAKVHEKACTLAQAATSNGLKLASDTFFDTLKIEHSDPASVVDTVAKNNIDIRFDKNYVCVSVDETTTYEDIAIIACALGVSIKDKTAKSCLSSEVVRSNTALNLTVFGHSSCEQTFTRLLRRLSAKDIALDRSMIPLGSCTMKLNAVTEMRMITHPKWVMQHPFAPKERLKGLHALVDDLEHMLAGITGFDAVSCQPNSGAQGEYAGLLAIKSFHEANGDTDRDICLIPQSAHGTNPASAVLAGMKVVSIETDSSGGVLMDDLSAKALEYSDRLAALMITFPSTRGVYNHNFKEVCAKIHEHGGQVYMDGANLNALIGVAQPGKLGADVMHINLHKTFCIPHGGGGPGMGPIACGAHLKEHLPGHPFDSRFDRKQGTVSAAPLGSGSLLAISWAYMRLMGAQGLRQATTVAVLAANYMAVKLSSSYQISFADDENKIAHECVFDLSSFKKSFGISVDDVAKRLIDLGFHAPTVSFPVPNCIMLEPTESEPLEEIDRYCEALIQIRSEISDIESGTYNCESNPLVNAPHVAEDLLAEDTSLGYSREVAAYPLSWVKKDKYWPPVSRIDQVFGDRNLRCVLSKEETLD